MGLQARKFYIDVQARQFVGGPLTTLPASAQTFFEEDVETINLYFLEPSVARDVPARFLDFSGATVKFAVGTVSPAALQTAWTPIVSAVTASITSLADGGSGNNEVQKLSFTAQPESGGFILELPARSISATSISAGLVTTSSPHGFFNGQVITLTGFSAPTGFSNGAAYYVIGRTAQTFRIAETANGSILTSISAGTGTLELNKITTGQIPYNASPSTMQSAFSAVSASVSVVPETNTDYTLTFINESGGINFAPITIASSTLALNPGLQANVSFATQEVADAISAGNTACTLEVEVTLGAARQTFTTNANLSADLITSTTPTPLPTVTATQFQLQDSGGDVWTISVTPEGELMLSK